MSRIAVAGTVVAPVIEQGQIVGPTQTIGTVATATLTADSLYLEFDTTLIPNTSTLVQVLNATLVFLQSNGSITP